MKNSKNIPNKLIHQTSPYLLQHAYNPVDWYPWGKEAFNKAEKENKPIFLSIGYSTCHWCHVMEHESFEDVEVAEILNNHFVSIKVDKEERPDIDSIYMNVCQSLTGSGGWPLTIIMSPNQKPFFAGTYFPKERRYGRLGLIDLLTLVNQKWESDREMLIQSGNEIVDSLNQEAYDNNNNEIPHSLVEDTIRQFKDSFDNVYGGFGNAPKFPTPHHLLFLLNYYEITKDTESLKMVEKTLLQMYKGGIFDHIGFGFSRYSTDAFWLVPHFEKMLYDNALLVIVYLKAFEITENRLYKTIAEKTMTYIFRELTSEEGVFYCAQDADSDNIEGKYYALTPNEIISLLGENDGIYFNHYFNITENGNFEGKNIPNLMHRSSFEDKIEKLLPIVYEYRKSREKLHKDDKILTSWNGLMIVALAYAFKILKDENYRKQAEKAILFIDNQLSNDNTLFVSYRNGNVSGNAFLDDYAIYIYAMITMYEVTLTQSYLQRAKNLTDKVLADFYDDQNGGFFLYGKENEQLILKPKETYDGAIPSGNSIMSYNLLLLSRLTKDSSVRDVTQKQLRFMMQKAKHYPIGYSFFMYTLLLYQHPTKEIVCVLKNKADLNEIKFPLKASIIIKEKETTEYPLKNNQTTFYICENNHCLPPTNQL